MATEEQVIRAIRNSGNGLTYDQIKAHLQLIDRAEIKRAVMEVLSAGLIEVRADRFVSAPQVQTA